ncbi:PREDICTED: uncharacterized protein LOC104808054 isoform X2 [Tarenaya hassleriana]|uniref:uncharacterized protein LOC104808054 isoform X2 n=1 Tax=Tarenaya hassleriana TaxID=28532 RepID=UPI00053C471C|nr:PREDICTED: uncharacterized protein LOC104808054 isoform X2 [Tarenaya hassleriana]
MATQSNSGFQRDGSLSSMVSRHAINFQSGAVNSTSDMIPMGSYFDPSSGIYTQNFPGNSGMNVINATPSGLLQPGNSSASSLLLDSVPSLKIDASLASEWSAEEQYRLEEGLEKYRDKPSIMKYVKIAASLPDKTVRDVALRCRWMTRKRRKAEELNGGRKISSSKDKQVDLSPNVNLPSVLPHNMASYPFLMPRASSNEHNMCKDFSGNAIHLLEQNVRAFSQIRANLSLYKLQDNLDLLCRTRNNLITIINDMSNMHGIMSQMPPLPVSINEDLASSVLTNITTLTMPFNTMPSGIHMKQEPLG